MAFPFYVYNIAYPAAGFKNQTHVCCNMIAKVACCPLILLSGDSTFQNTHRNTQQAHISHFKGMDGILSCNTVQARYGTDRAFTKGFDSRAVYSSCMKNWAENSVVLLPHNYQLPHLCQLVGMICIPVRAGRKIAFCGLSLVWLLLIVS